MSLRQEQIVLIGTVALLGVLGWSSFDSPAVVRRGGSKASGDATAFERYPAPDTSLALPAPRKLDEFDRDVFSQPTDTKPLPPLPLEEPPIQPLWALRPPPAFALAPRVFETHLRADATPSTVAKLFVTADEAESAEADVDDLSDAGAADSALDELRKAVSQAALDPEQRAAQIASWKKLYDWMRLGETAPIFGQIHNPDRFGLKTDDKRSTEPVLFVEINPETGLERFPGQKPVPYERGRVVDFEFADTDSNYVQRKRREFVPPIGPVLYPDLLAFAAKCIELRLQAREALSVAEEMFLLAADAPAQDPLLPRLGLARCYEAGFQFEKAYEVYTALLAQFPHRPEVHVALGTLEERLRLFDSAEERMRTAIAKGGASSWLVQRAIGRFLLGRGRHDEALGHLNDAFRDEPKEPSYARQRALIRADRGAALLALGRADEAKDAFEKALQADAGDLHAEAGRLAAIYVAGGKAEPSRAAAQGAESSFELLVSRALLDLEAKNWVVARDQLLLAVAADPLRAAQAWGALSWLAEITGYPEEALRQIEQAREADPSDPWILYQHGRLLAARQDFDGARAAFVGALDIDLDFTDAMIALAELARRAGLHADAERYFERVLSSTPVARAGGESKLASTRRAEVHARRGINLLRLGELAAARESFEAALALDPLHPLARAGQAWCTYRGGDSAKAIQQFAELNDDRRSLPETDPFRVFALAQMARIQEHESKVLWTDRFERRRLMNGWDVEEAVGPLITLADGSVRISGNFNTNGKTRMLRQYGAQDFVSIEMDVTIPASCNAKVGVFVGKERRVSAAQTQVQGAISIARRRDGGLVVLAMDTATADENWEDVAEVGGRPWWPTDRPVRVRIERTGEGSESVARMTIDGVAVREGIRLQRLAASTNDLKVGVFVEGQTGLPAEVVVDNVEVVYKLRR